MVTLEKILNIVFEAFDEINQMLPREQHLKKSTDTYLYGNSGKLESLTLINLIVEIEGKLEQEYNKPITLADENPSDGDINHYENVLTLAQHILNLVKGKINEEPHS